MFTPTMSRMTDAPLLTPEEERKLGARAIKGDVRARNKLIEANVRFAMKIAHVYRNRGLPLEDLIQEASIGLATAASKFDPKRGVRFSTYAGWWVRQAVARAIGDQSRTIRLPGHVNAKLAIVRRVERRLRGELGREPLLEEIAKEARLDVAFVEDIMPRGHEPKSLADPVGDHGDELINLLPGPPDRVDDQMAKDQGAEILLLALSELTEREREILTLRFGLHDDRERTLSDVGQGFGLTRERIRQLEKMAFERLRVVLTRYALADERGLSGTPIPVKRRPKSAAKSSNATSAASATKSGAKSGTQLAVFSRQARIVRQAQMRGRHTVSRPFECR